MTACKKAGQPTKYEERFKNMAYVACVEGGFTDIKLAKLFSVDKATINNWKHAHPKFFDSIRKGKDIFNVLLAEESLLKRVKGGSYQEITKKRQVIIKEDGKPVLDEYGNKKTEFVITKTVSKKIHPSDKALEFFLRNRSPERWPDKHDLNVSGDLHIDLVDFCNDEKEDK